MEPFEQNIESKAESIVNAFHETLEGYKNNYGDDKIEVIDSRDNIIHAIRYVGVSELIELTTLNDDNNLTLRLTHYSEFDLTIKNSKY